MEPNGEGERLQQKLHAWSDSQWAQGKNWLQDWWFQYAYLAWPEPLPVWTSPFYFWKAIQPGDHILNAAKAIFWSTKWKLDILDTEKLEPEMMGKTPLCMDQFRRLFTTSRRPGLNGDTLDVIKPEKHIVVICRRKFYSFDVIDENNHVIPLSQIRSYLKDIWDIAHSGKEVDYSPGLFTAVSRPTWAKVRGIMLQDTQNAKYLDIIDRSLFVTVLEDSYPENDTAAVHEVSGGDASNRWFDKTFNIIVFANGTIGVNNEHTPAEATNPLVLMQWAVEQMLIHNPPNPVYEGKEIQLPKPEEFKWKINEEVAAEFPKCHQEFIHLWKDLDTQVFYFEGFGTQWCKTHKVSADGLVQMAMQLAYQRLHRGPTATYETGHLRAFKNGRTETVRSCSIDSQNFVLSMDKDTPAADRIKLLEKSLKSHRDYTMKAMSGRGCDRHLMGLRILAMSEGKSPEIFTDPAYARSTDFKLSTSTVFTRELIGGFGPVKLNGYGICYQMWKNRICIVVSSRFSCNSTSSHRMARAINDALMDFKKLLEYKASSA
eukprot:TRINITY_DN11314_c0_g1_i1.p1 TRINITY_DN11314_c0_g1~~TRINITY_DN11314_c0_g1_i1.p1  ORF type:complete len:609 (+),score=146.80 TRINITY_DN11314_c0_g1_i1:198-1829(+)